MIVVKALSHSLAARAQTFASGPVRVAPVSDPCSLRARSRSAERVMMLRFPKSSKLLRHADFQRVYKQGRRHFAANMTVFYLARAEDVVRPPSAGDTPRIGFTVGRVLGQAVERNRIKRRMREAVRYNLASLREPVDVVINPKKSAQSADFEVLKSEVARAFDKIRSTVSRRPSTEQSQ